MLVDPNPGPAAVAEGLPTAAAPLRLRRRSCCSTSAATSWPTATSPGWPARSPTPSCCAAPHRLEAAGPRVVGAVFGAGCDGELTPAEVAERLAEVAAAGGGRWRPLAPDDATLDVLDRRRRGGADRGQRDGAALRPRRDRAVAIREGRRSVELTPLGGRVAFFEPAVALATAARLAAAVQDAPDLVAADAILERMGVRTELAYERDAARRGRGRLVSR